MVDITAESMAEERVDRVLTQYRESPKLLFLMRTYLTKAAELALQVCDLPDKFYIETATHDQLTILGRRMGWPRCHCVCDTQTVFGFECEGVPEEQPVAGFCDENVIWQGCETAGIGEICINSDDIYRKFLKVRRYQMLGLFDIGSLQTCLEILFGEDAVVLYAGQGRVVIAPGRALTESEFALLQLYPRILPVALGINVTFHFNATGVFGFGDGWGGFCTDSGEFGDDGEPLTDEFGTSIVTENGDEIASGVSNTGAPWMCEIDVKPYGCS